MLLLQRHRGPDDIGSFQTAKAALAMTRLGINDLKHGNQPFFSRNNLLALVGNGEIYNSKEIRTALVGKGYTFRSASDIEVALHMYEDCGIEAFARLSGMFAIALVDQQKHEVVLARDVMGEKPLYFSITEDGRLVFASELRTMALGGSVPTRLRADVWYEYLLTGYINDPNTPLQSVYRLDPGSYLVFSLETGIFSIRPFSSFHAAASVSSEPPLLISSHIEQSVRDCLQSDVPIGLALSGGLDSSLIAGLAAREGAKLLAISVGYEGAESSDESFLALDLASELGLECMRTSISTKDVVESFAELCWLRDEPIGDIAGHGYLKIAQAARSAGVPVVLTGQGGDELFWGYEWTRRVAERLDFSTSRHRDPHSLRNYLRGFRLPRSPLEIPMWVESGFGYRSGLREFFADVRAPLRVGGNVALHRNHPLAYRYERDIRRLLLQPEAGITNEIHEAGKQVTPSHQVSHELLRSYLLMNGLAQTDRLFMSQSVEARSPLLSRALVFHVMNARRTLDDYSTIPKNPLREVAAQVLPERVLHRPKRGFTPPTREWVQGIADSGFLNERPLETVRLGILDEAAIAYMGSPFSYLRRSKALWVRIAVLEAWLRRLQDELAHKLEVAK